MVVTVTTHTNNPMNTDCEIRQMRTLLIIVPLTLLLLTAAVGQAGEDGSGAKAQTASAGMPGHPMPTEAKKPAITTPRVPFKYGLGMRKFRDMCAKCHGDWGQGTEQGPPLIHSFYEPSHHGDAAFYQAALKGVKAHHWNFGDMPPVEGATAKDVEKILPFIRWLQQQNGIY